MKLALRTHMVILKESSAGAVLEGAISTMETPPNTED